MQFQHKFCIEQSVQATSCVNLYIDDLNKDYFS